jgi:hypothetical protein
MRTRRRCSADTWCTCRVRETTNSAAMPIGTLTRNTQRQPVIPAIDADPAKNPPISGPSTLEVPNTAMK